jgi:hypothetical protein
MIHPLVELIYLSWITWLEFNYFYYGWFSCLIKGSKTKFFFLCREYHKLLGSWVCQYEANFGSSSK